MKRSDSALFVTVTLMAICLFLAATAVHAEAASLEVHDASICIDVENRACVDASATFPVGIDRLCCFTRIVGAQGGDTEVTHVWYFGDVERARTKLRVGSSSWRTYSSKIIQSHEIGDWRVDVVGPTGEVLTAVEFEIVQ